MLGDDCTKDADCSLDEKCVGNVCQMRAIERLGGKTDDE